jgi:hypothetical protein
VKVEVTTDTVQLIAEKSEKLTLAERIGLLDRQEWYPDVCRLCGQVDPKHKDLNCPKYEYCYTCRGSGPFGYVRDHRCPGKDDDDVEMDWDNDYDVDLYHTD